MHMQEDAKIPEIEEISVPELDEETYQQDNAEEADNEQELGTL